MSRRKYIDEFDIKLLNVIKENPEYTVIQLGEAIDLTPGPTNTRVIRLKKEGFLEKDFSINYSKFGIEKRVFSFQLNMDLKTSTKKDVKSIFKEFSNKVKKERDILIESIDLLEDQDHTNWIWISFYPLSEKDLNSKNEKPTIKKYDNSNLSMLVKEYSKGISKLYNLVQTQKEIPQLSNIHVIRRKPLE